MRRLVIVVMVLLVAASASAWEVIRQADFTGVEGWVVLARPADYHEGGWSHSDPEIVIRWWDSEWGVDVFLITGGPSVGSNPEVYLQLGEGSELKFLSGSLSGDASGDNTKVFMPRSDVQGFVDEMAALEEDDFVTVGVDLSDGRILFASFFMSGFSTALKEWKNAHSPGIE